MRSGIVAFIWIVSDKRKREMTHYLQIFPRDKKHQIMKGAAAEVMASYATEPVMIINGRTEPLTADYDITTYRIEGENAYLIIKNKGNLGAEYSLRFSEGGRDVYIEQDMLHEIRATYRLVSAHPKDVTVPGPNSRAYRLEQKMRPAELCA